MNTINDILESNMKKEPAIQVECITASGKQDCIVGNMTELAVVISGTVTICADEGHFSFRSGQLFVRNAGQDYSIEKEDRLTLFRLRFNKNWLLESFPTVPQMEGYRFFFILMPHYGFRSYYNTHFRLLPSAIEYIRSLFNGMLSESTQQPEAYDAVMRCLLINLLVFLCREIVHANIPGESNLHEISCAISYIEKNFMHPVTLEQLSNIASLSPRHFDRIFKKIYNMTPFEYILKLRLSYAYDLLRNTAVSIGSVAEECGFSDSNYFTRCFKREFGRSPSAVRASLVPDDSESLDHLPTKENL